MKVLQVLNHFLPFQTAGTEVYTWALSKQLQKLGVEVKVIIPNKGTKEAGDYVYDGIVVHQFAEPSLVDRSLIMGFRAPEGLKHFVAYLKREQPDLVHFHELAGSNGITLKHVLAAKETGAKVMMTFHLAGYSCKTGTLVYKGEMLCDGVIDLQKCSTCYLHTRGFSKAAPYLVRTSNVLHQLSIDASQWNNKVGTALGTVHLLAKLKTDLHTLVDACDRVVSITHWYQQVLLANGIDRRKISFIPQGLPQSRTALRVENKATQRPLRLLFLGRINPFKGLHLLLEALKEIDSGMVTLSVYGNSDDAEYQSELRASTSNRINIYWKGNLQQKEVVETMQAHDVLCLCSTFSEMSPLVIQEAFAAGIPVIASHVYGNAEQIRHGENGLLFKFKDVESLREQIQACIDDPTLVNRLSKNIQPPLDFSVVAKAYYQLYQKLKFPS
ncbi:glycosyltransferase involved in cell wall biosynthesis [Algoriphagus boseongensis]|uniref:Glycosyltransferase involved in cell wall biosynthesis n=1 Tax=Algoriphagus boseongensis TaxID=1442587 RepID=A0A4R6TAY4_9BACT|nr:glycosyltransferase [Algoriphagus boseongensis]TDQ19369.1 glycosyltransferase involved in cell wall biosynthesis [Algoriphagus boseongensis]